MLTTRRRALFVGSLGDGLGLGERMSGLEYDGPFNRTGVMQPFVPADHIDAVNKPPHARYLSTRVLAMFLFREP